MGIFVINKNNFKDYEDDGIILDDDKIEDIAEEYAKEALKIASHIPNTSIPDFIWQIQQNLFENDDYLLRGACTNPNILKAYSIGRKYSNYWKYVDAMVIYNDYADFITSLYGDFNMMKNAYYNGLSSIYIPPKPKLSSRKGNKFASSVSFVPSRVKDGFEIDNDKLSYLINLIPLRDLDKDQNVKFTKTEKETIKRLFETQNERNRVNNIYTIGNNESKNKYDNIIAFMTSSISDNTSKAYMEDDSLSAYIEKMQEEKYEFDFIRERKIADADNPTYVKDGVLVRASETRQLEILEELEKNGFDFIGSSVTEGMNKHAVRAITRKYGNLNIKDISSMTPKERKKFLKKEAKRKMKERKKVISDRRISEMLLQNKTSFHNDGLSFRLTDLFPDS